MPSCYGVMRPAVAPGDPCTSSIECVPAPDGSLTSCLPPAPGAGGICAVLGPPVRVGAGERCGRTCDTFDGEEDWIDVFADAGACFESDGSFCSSDTGRCESLGELGDPCDTYSFLECREELYCSDESRTCQRRSEVGATCEPSFHDPCVVGSSCELVGCVPAAVGSVAQCTHRCVASRGEGDPCSESEGLLCPYFLFCAPESRTCEQRRLEGGPCRDDDACDFGTVCDPVSALCVPVRGAGESCTPPTPIDDAT